MKSHESRGVPLADSSNSFRLLLRAELARRCALNPQYSLRALAMHLGTDHATLSQLMRGRRTLTPETIRRLGARLGLADDVIERYVRFEHLAAARGTAATPGDDAHGQVRQLAHDTAQVLSGWHHFALLELVRLDGFRPDVRWIARVLDIEPDAVAIALQRLLRLGLLEMAAPDRWVDLTGHAVADLDAFQEAAVRHLFEQTARLSARALRRAPDALQDHSTTTLAVRSERLPEALRLLARMRRELVELLESDGSRDEVYGLQIRFFPITLAASGGAAPKKEQ